MLARFWTRSPLEGVDPMNEPAPDPAREQTPEPWDERTWCEQLNSEPTPEQRAARWSNRPISDERTFSDRLSVCASAELNWTWQATLGPLVVDALVTSTREDLGATLTRTQRRMLSRPLWWVRMRGRRAPDIAMIDEQGRIVLVVEAKGPKTQVQWTPARPLRDIEQWAHNSVAEEIRAWLRGPAAQSTMPHVYDGNCRCWARKSVGNGLHAESLHHGDVYYSARDWAPPAHRIHHDCVWLALLPRASTVGHWQYKLSSSRQWVIASVPALLATLRTHLETRHDELTDWEHGQLTSLVNGGELLYATALTTPW
jgi:hypothetical protein